MSGEPRAGAGRGVEPPPKPLIQPAKPAASTALTIEDFPLLYPRKLSKRLNAPGELIAPARQLLGQRIEVPLTPPGLPVPHHVQAGDGRG